MSEGCPAEIPTAFLSLRQSAELTLREWVAPTPRLTQLRAELLDAVAANPGCMWRDGGPVHFTAGLVVLDADLSHVALTLHSKAKRWFQFGGHFEVGDAGVQDAATREGREESGLRDFRVHPGLVQIDAHDLPSAFGRCRRHLDLRFAAVTEHTASGASEGLIVSSESDDVRWWPVDSLPDGTEESLREAVFLSREVLRP